MKNLSPAPLPLPSQAPVMVLPNALLFPNSLLPLFIFEPRYREMLAWSLKEDRMFCIAPLRPGVDEARTEQDFAQRIGLGLVRACVGREDGTSHLILQGLARVEITSFVQHAPFRIANFRELKSAPVDPDEGEILTARLLETCARLRAGGFGVPEALDAQLAGIDDPAVLADVIAHTLLQDSEKRQTIFEELQVSRRLHLLIDFLEREIP